MPPLHVSRFCENVTDGSLIHRPDRATLESEFAESRFVSEVSRLATVKYKACKQDSMTGEVRRYLFAAKTGVALAADAASSFLHSKLHSKILIFGALAASLAVAAVPILSGSDMPRVTANGTLKCYGSAGNYEPCVTSGSAPALQLISRTTPADPSPSRLNGRTTPADAPASWTATTLYQQARWATADQPANWETSPPAPQRSTMPAKHAASPACRRKLLPCFFSALRRGLTHIASAAANLGQVRPAREHL